MPGHDLLSLDTNAVCLFCYTAFKILNVSESGDNRFFLCQKLLDSPATCLVQVPNLYSGEKKSFLWLALKPALAPYVAGKQMS